MVRKTLFSAALIAALTVSVQTQAHAQVTGTYTVSGSSGSWFLNFAFTNLYADRVAFAFHSDRKGLAFAGAPTGYGESTCFDFLWSIVFCDPGEAEAIGIAPGATLGGFLATSSLAGAPSYMVIEALTCAVDCAANDNVEFEQFQATLRSVPEPGSMMLIASGLLGLIGVRRRRQDVGEDI